MRAHFRCAALHASAAYARVVGHQLVLRAASYLNGVARFAEGRRVVREAEKLGELVAGELKRQESDADGSMSDAKVG